MNTEQLKTDRTKEEILRNRLLEGLKKTHSGYDEKWYLNEVNKIFNPETPEHTEVLTVFYSVMQDFASQESKLAVEKDRESRWIKIEPGHPKPEYMQCVIIRDTIGLVLQAQYGGSDTHPVFSVGDLWYTATHWQPLPEPPKLLNL